MDSVEPSWESVAAFRHGHQRWRHDGKIVGSYPLWRGETPAFRFFVRSKVKLHLDRPRPRGIEPLRRH